MCVTRQWARTASLPGYSQRTPRRCLGDRRRLITRSTTSSIWCEIHSRPFPRSRRSGPPRGRYMSRHIPIEPPDSLLLRSAKCWLHWNRLVEDRTEIRVRIEDMPAALAILPGRIGAGVDWRQIRQVPTDFNTRRFGRGFNLFESKCLKYGVIRDHAFLRKWLSKRPAAYGDIEWDDLRTLDPSLAEQIKSKAIEYGYGSAAANPSGDDHRSIRSHLDGDRSDAGQRRVAESSQIDA